MDAWQTTAIGGACLAIGFLLNSAVKAATDFYQRKKEADTKAAIDMQAADARECDEEAKLRRADYTFLTEKLREHITKLEGDMEDLKGEVRKMEAKHAKCLEESAALRGEVRHLTQSNELLKARIDKLEGS